MADRLTELQGTINQQAENFCNAVGVLQQTAQPSYFQEFDRSIRTLPENQVLPSGLTVEDTAKNFTRVIVETAQNIQALVENLPDEECSVDLQNQALIRLAKDQRLQGDRLLEIVGRLETRLAEVQQGLADISSVQLKAQALEGIVAMEESSN